MIHTVKGFGIVNKAEIDVFLELSCFSPPLTSKWCGDRQPSRKRFQNDDTEYDQDLRKIMEAEIEKMQEMFNKDIEESKNTDK